MSDLTPEKIEALRKAAKYAAPRWIDYREFSTLYDRDDVAYIRAFPPSVALALLSAASELDEALRLLRETIEPGSAIDYADWRKRRDALLARHSGGTA